MRVLFISRSYIGINTGGGIGYQIMETRNALVRKGIEVALLDPWQDQVRECDICHFFSSDPAMIYHLEHAKRLKKKVIFSPILANLHYSPLIHRVFVKTAEWSRGILSAYKTLKRMMNLSDVIIALNQQEKDRLVYAFGQSPQKVRLVPNGYAANFAEPDPIPFINKYGIKEFVLTVSFISPRKNQKTLIRAMEGLPYKLIIIGGVSLGCADYEQECRRMAGPNVEFLGRMENSDPMLSSAYAAARLFVLPSIFEIQPLVFPEAALGGCPIITSTHVSSHPGLEDITHHVKAYDVKCLRRVIDKLMRSDINQSKIRDRAKAIKNWDQVAQDIYQLYEDQSH